MSSRDLRSIGVFTTLAFALAWLLALPLWFGDGLASPEFALVAAATMTTPRSPPSSSCSSSSGHSGRRGPSDCWPLRPVRRLLGYAALGIIVSIALVLVALPVGALLGVYPADFVNFSAFQQVLDEQAGAAGVARHPDTDRHAHRHPARRSPLGGAHQPDPGAGGGTRGGEGGCCRN